MSSMDASQILAAKRLQGELKQLEKNREEFYHVVQDEKDSHTFYFLIRGDNSTPYKGGYYIGKIALPKDYPTTPGDFYMLTPSGRFNVNAKICLTNSGYHKESWTPMWNINNMVVAFVSIFSSDDTSGISHIKESPSERHAKAEASVKYNMTHHKDIWLRFTQFVKPDGTVRTDAEVKQWIQENGPKRPARKTVPAAAPATGTAKEPEKVVKVVRAPNPAAKSAVKPATKQAANTTGKKIEQNDKVVDNLDQQGEENPVAPANPKRSPVKAQVQEKSPAKKGVVNKKESPVKAQVQEKSPAKKGVANKNQKNKEDARDVEIKPKSNSKSEVKKVVPTTDKPVSKNTSKQEVKKTHISESDDVEGGIEEQDEENDASEDEVISFGKKTVNTNLNSDSSATKTPPSKSKKIAKVDKNDEVPTPTEKNVGSAPSISEAREAQRSETLKVVGRNKKLPQNYQEWRKVVSDMTLDTFDPKLLMMVF